MRRIHVLLALLVAVLFMIPFRTTMRGFVVSAIQRAKGKRTVSDCLKQFGPVVYARLAPRFKELNLTYPPKNIVLVVLKHEKILQLWVSGESKNFRLLKIYPILASSGKLGPKLREGDRQVPEGFYEVESLNPNSAFHLGLRLNYPNRFDIAKAREENRTDLGSDIMIHGKATSIGCVSIGDPAVEELFVLAALAGIDKVSVIISPYAFKVGKIPDDPPLSPSWVAELYAQIRSTLAEFEESAAQPKQ